MVPFSNFEHPKQATQLNSQLTLPLSSLDRASKPSHIGTYASTPLLDMQDSKTTQVMAAEKAAEPAR